MARPSARAAVTSPQAHAKTPQADQRHELDRTLRGVPSPVPAIRAELEREDDWLTTAEVAERVRRRPRTVLAWMKAGKLKAAGQLPDGAYVFDRQVVIDFVRFGTSGGSVKHVTVDPTAVRAFVDAAHRRAKKGRSA